MAELSAEYGVHATMISTWKQELVKRAWEFFKRGSRRASDPQKTIDELYRQIAQLRSSGISWPDSLPSPACGGGR